MSLSDRPCLNADCKNRGTKTKASAHGSGLRRTVGPLPRHVDPDQPVTAVADTEYCCDGMITFSVEQLDNHQRNAYGTTPWATDYAGRNPVEGVNGMIKNDGSLNRASCRVFGLAAHTLAALMAAVIHNLKHTHRARRARRRKSQNPTTPDYPGPTPPNTPPAEPGPHPTSSPPTRAPP